MMRVVPSQIGRLGLLSPVSGRLVSGVDGFGLDTAGLVGGNVDTVTWSGVRTVVGGSCSSWIGMVGVFGSLDGIGFVGVGFAGVIGLIGISGVVGLSGIWSGVLVFVLVTSRCRGSVWDFSMVNGIGVGSS